MQYNSILRLAPNGILPDNQKMTMKTTTYLSILIVMSMLTACATTDGQPATSAPRKESSSNKQPQQLKFKLASGTYRCELGKKVEIQRDARNPDSIKVSWQGNRHTLQRYDSTSGLPRYEDRQNGLVWIDLPWKSVLMDSKTGSPIANECKAASS